MWHDPTADPSAPVPISTRGGVRRRRRRSICVVAASSLLAGLLSLVTAPAPSASATTFPAGCQTSPYGNSLTWAGRDMIFLDGINSNGEPARTSWKVNDDNTTIGFGLANFTPDNRVSSATSSVEADLDGDGRAEVVRAVVPAATGTSTELTAAQNPGTGPTITTPVVSLPRYTKVVLAAGRFGTANPSSTAPPDQVAVLGTRTDGTVELSLFYGTVQPLALTRMESTLTITSQASSYDPKYNVADVAFADVDGDGWQDVVVAYSTSKADGIHLRWYQDYNGAIVPGAPGIDPVGGALPAVAPHTTGLDRKLALSVGNVTNTSLGYAPRHIKLVSGDFNGDYRDELAVAWDDDNPDPFDWINVRTVDVTSIANPGSPGGGVFPSKHQRTFFQRVATDAYASMWDITAVDLNNDVADELILAQSLPDRVNIQVLNGSADPPVGSNESLMTVASWDTTDIGSGPAAPGPRDLALASGDLNKDGRPDLVMAVTMRDGLTRISVLGTPRNTSSLVEEAYGKKATLMQTRDLIVGDWNNTSVRTVYTAPPGGPRCVDVDVPTILSAIDAHPQWANLSLQGREVSTTGMSYDATSGSSSSYAQSSRFSWSTGVEISVGGELYVGEGIGFGGEYSATVSDRYIHDGGHSSGWSENSYTATSTGWDNRGVGRAVQVKTVPYRCYFYGFFDGGVQQPAYNTMCTVRPMTDANAPQTWTAADYDVNFGNVANPDQGGSWVPVQPEWTNLLIQRSNADISVSSTASGLNASTAKALAIDGKPDGLDPSTVWRSASETNPYWQVDLGKTTDLSAVTVWPERALSCNNVCVTDPSKTTKLEVFVFNDKSLLGLSASELESRSDVDKFTWSGPMLGTKVNFETRMEKADQARGLKVKDPARGRYVRVQRIGQGDLRLAEVQVYPAQSYVDPVRYPIAVTKIPAGTGYRTDFFDATVWNDADPANPKHIWVSGNLMYDGQGTSDKAAINIGQGHLLDKTFGMTQGKDIARNWQTSETDGYEVSESGGGGGGLSIANVTVKVTSSQGASWTNDHGTQTSIGDSFVVNGYFNGMDNSPPPGDSASYTAPNKCMLIFRPFYYTGYNENSYGLVQRYTVVSHIVRLDGLDRAADLQNCRDGVRRHNGVNVAPVVQDFATTVAQTGDTTIDVASRATDQNNTDGIVVGLPDADGVVGDSKDKEIIRVADVATGAATAGNKTSVSTTAGGKATIDGGNVVYSPPAAGLTGTDTFYLDVTDGDLVSSRAMVTVYPQPVKNGGFETCTSVCTLDGSASVAPWTGSLTGNVFLWGGVPSSTHSGSSLAVLKAPTYGGTYTMSQSFAVPTSGTPKLTVWWKAPFLGGADSLTMSILDGATEQALKTVTGSPTSAWAQSVFDLSAYKGRTVSLQFKAYGPNDGVQSTWDIDDVALN